jgi:hypothetical protein
MALFDRYIRVSAEVLDALDDDPLSRAVYLELCRRAEWKQATKRQTKNGPVEVDLADCYFGRGELATKVGDTERRVRASIERLVRAGAIAIKTSKVGTVATIIDLKEKLLSERVGRPTERPSDRPTGVQQASTTKILDQDLSRRSPLDLDLDRPVLPKPNGGGDHDHVRAIVRTSTWERQRPWWTCMLEAHDRLRAKGIVKPNDDKLAQHPHEQWLHACEKHLRAGGYDDAGVDAKMRHVVLVYEAEAEALGHANYFKPAIMWDTSRADRFPRKVDTTLDEARSAGARSSAPESGLEAALRIANGGVAPKRRRRDGEMIGAATPRKDHRTDRCLMPFAIKELGEAAQVAYEDRYLELGDEISHSERDRRAREAAYEADRAQRSLPLTGSS